MRQRGCNNLNNQRKSIQEQIDRMKSENQVLYDIERDPGFMKIPRLVMVWMPNDERIIYDMACRTAQAPTRFKSVFHPAPHVFYKKHLNLAYPINPVGAKYEPPAAADSQLLTKALMDRHPVEEWGNEARAEWEFYKSQMQRQIDEPLIESAIFPSRHEYAMYLCQQWPPPDTRILIKNQVHLSMGQLLGVKLQSSTQQTSPTMCRLSSQSR